jgi:hypothetical protein
VAARGQYTADTPHRGASATDVHGSPGMVVLLGGVCAVRHARRAQLRGLSLYWSLACDGIEQSSLEAHRDCSRQRRRRQRREVDAAGAESIARAGILTKPET